MTYGELKSKTVAALIKFHAKDKRYGADSWASAFFLAVENDFASCVDYADFLKRESADFAALSEFGLWMAIKDMRDEMSALVKPGKKTINAAAKAFIKRLKEEGIIF